jgi:predicted Rossmann fold nucleotide-binding protein DprA/Smf involved in DNA uptake
MLGSTALAAVPDNLIVLEGADGKTVLHTRGRMIQQQKDIFDLRGHRFELNDSAGAELRGKADRQADILEMLADSPATQAEIRDELGLDAGNLSKMCKALAQQNKIKRERRGSPWSIVESDLF